MKAIRIDINFADMVDGLLPLSEAPIKPDDAQPILLDGPDKVFQKGQIRWRYAPSGDLIRVIEYAQEGIARAWQDDRRL